MSSRLPWFTLAALVLTACDAAPAPPGKDPPERPARPASSTAASAIASASPAPLPTLTAAPAAKGEGFAGTWTGSYDARKGSVTLPPKVKDAALAADDGKRAVGPGTVELGVAADGEVRGKLKGALGACTLSGRVEDQMLRAAVVPEDPRAADAMTGVLVGTLKDGRIHGEIHVAGPDATVVRESAIELARKDR